jgi:hypothetical protein
MRSHKWSNVDLLVMSLDYVKSNAELWPDEVDAAKTAHDHTDGEGLVLLQADPDY